MSGIWEKMGNPMSFERVMGPNRHNMENYGDLQPIAQSMKSTLWVPSETFLLASSLTFFDSLHEEEELYGGLSL